MFYCVICKAIEISLLNVNSSFPSPFIIGTEVLSRYGPLRLNE